MQCVCVKFLKITPRRFPMNIKIIKWLSRCEGALQGAQKRGREGSIETKKQDNNSEQ